jgi:hypothetical protein
MQEAPVPEAKNRAAANPAADPALGYLNPVAESPAAEAVARA